jgi:hypothetical protein
VADGLTLQKNEAACTLYDMQKGQNDQDDSDHDQGMDPASAIRPVVIPGTPTEETKQPENKQDYDNSPQHELSPFG